jgi:hypothetical protein
MAQSNGKTCLERDAKFYETELFSEQNNVIPLDFILYHE